MSFALNKTIRNTILFFITLLVAPIAYAGTAVSGGGGAYVCRDSAGNIKSTHLVDLWESQNTPFHWLTNQPVKTISIPLHSNTPVEEQTQNALKNLESLDSELALQVSKALKLIKNVHHYLPGSVSLTVPNDLQTDYFPTGCLPEGMLRYNGYSDTLDIKQDLFDKLVTNTDISASYMHEALYKVLREIDKPATNSILIRRLNACLYSPECMALVVAKEKIPADSPIYDCQSKAISATAYLLQGQVISSQSKWKIAVHRYNDLKFGAPMSTTVTPGQERKITSWFERFGYQPFSAMANLVFLAPTNVVLVFENPTSSFSVNTFSRGILAACTRR